jgi:hypothetical protein
MRALVRDFGNFVDEATKGVELKEDAGIEEVHEGGWRGGEFLAKSLESLRLDTAIWGVCLLDV